MDKQSRLDQAYKRVCRPSSHFWAFWDPEDIDTSCAYEVEIRLNLPDGDELEVTEIEGWTIAHRKTGMLFLRRSQHIDKKGVRSLFLDALRIAVERDWQFHSWMHDPYLPNRPS